MKPYFVALTLGALVGVVYGVAGVRSPAPPVVALVGLLGMLVGQTIVSSTITIIAGGQFSFTALASGCAKILLGRCTDTSPLS
jgi:XapX domain-containing protein